MAATELVSIFSSSHIQLGVCRVVYGCQWPGIFLSIHALVHAVQEAEDLVIIILHASHPKLGRSISLSSFPRESDSDSEWTGNGATCLSIVCIDGRQCRVCQMSMHHYEHGCIASRIQPQGGGLRQES